MTDIRLLVVAGDPLARAGLATLLADRPGITLAGRASGADVLAAGLDVYRPDAIVWDLGWEPDEGLAQLAELAPELEGGRPPVIALVAGEEQAAAAWAAGVRGVLPREVAAERLLAAVAAAVEGLVAVDADLAVALLPAGPLAAPSPAEELTPRELEVLQLLAEGLANRAIAHRLGISEHTVKFHVTAIMGKLGAQSRTAAVVRGTQLGLILL